MPEKYLATITILVRDRQKNVAAMNRLLTDNGHLIAARLGVNPERSCLTGCTGLIVIVIEGTKKEAKDLAKKLDKLYGIVAKMNIMAD